MSRRDDLLVSTLAMIDYLFELEAGDESFFELCADLRKTIPELMVGSERRDAAELTTKMLRETLDDDSLTFNPNS